MKTFKKFLNILLLAVMLGGALSPVAFGASDFSVSCRSAILVDVNTGQVIYEQNADSKQYPASITKVMTALLVREHTQPDAVVTVTESALTGLDSAGSSVSLVEGEQMSVNELLHCMLISSGNDAANVLAEYVGGTVANFVDMMNEKAASLGCDGTHFMNPHGLHHENHYTTARDIYIFTREFVADPVLMQIAKEIRKIFRSQDVVARIGGDEFVVAMIGSGDSDEKSQLFRESFVFVLNMINDESGKDYRVSASIGLSCSALDDVQNIEELIEKGKNGSLDFDEALEELDYDIDKMDKIYDALEENEDIIKNDISSSELDKIESEVESFGAGENMERILEQEGLAIDDPVRMYLKEIGRVPLLDANTERELAERQAPFCGCSACYFV